MCDSGEKSSRFIFHLKKGNEIHNLEVRSDIGMAERVRWWTDHFSSSVRKWRSTFHVERIYFTVLRSGHRLMIQLPTIHPFTENPLRCQWTFLQNVFVKYFRFISYEYISFPSVKKWKHCLVFPQFSLSLFLTDFCTRKNRPWGHQPRNELDFFAFIVRKARKSSSSSSSFLSFRLGIRCGRKRERIFQGTPVNYIIHYNLCILPLRKL